MCARVKRRVDEGKGCPGIAVVGTEEGIYAIECALSREGQKGVGRGRWQGARVATMAE